MIQQIKKDTRNLLRLEKENEEIKDRILRDIIKVFRLENFEKKEKENYYKL